MNSQSNLKLQLTLKALLDSRQPKIKQIQDRNTNGRSLEIKIRSQTINIPLESNRQYRNTTGSFR